MSLARPIPVFRPTTEEFSDFSKYVTSIEPIAEQYGICKIIPPEGWRPRNSSYDDLNIEIPCPIRQFVHGKQGVYQVVNVMEKPMTLAQFKQASEEQFAKCFPKSKREGSDAEKFDIEELERRFWKNLTFHAPLYGADMLGTLFEEEDDAKGSEEEQEANDEKESGGEIDIVEIDEPPAKGKKKAAQRSPKRKRGSTESDASFEAKALDETTKDQKKRNAWNLGHLDTLLSQRLGKLLPGVTSPYLYFGMWKSLFACHTEDMDLYSINFLHFGKPKVWYGVPSAQKHRVDQVARLHFPMQFKECSEFLRHKSAMFSPSVLKMGNVSMTHAVQQPGEFIITFPGAYHFGFNAGFNCAEAVNFALQRWLDFGKKAKPCKCVADSVTIDVGMFINMVTNGEEELLPDVLPAAKKSKTAPTTKPKRVAKRRSREKATATTTATAKATTAIVGGRSMGVVAGRMMAAPQASAALPEPPEFVEETLGDEDVPVFSDDELRSGDENDGGEYREGSKKQAKKQAKKPRRSKRVENKRNAAPSGTTDESTEAPASSKSEIRPKERKEPVKRKKQASVAAAVPAADATPNGSNQLLKATEATATTPKPQPKKRAVKRKNAKLADRFQKKAKGQEEPSQEPKTAVNTREYQGLKIIIRPPRADNSNGSPVPTSAPAPPTTTAGSAPTGMRKQRATASKRSKPQKSAAIKKGKKANPDLMPEGKTTAWQQLNAEANRQHNRDGTDTDLTRVTGPESAGRQTVPLQPALSSFYAPYLAGAAGRQQGPPSYGHFLIAGDRTQQERLQAQAAPEPRHAVQMFPTLKDFMSSQVAYPPISTFTSTALSMGSAPEPTAVQPGSAYSLALEMQRHKLKELREKQQQLQQLRQERQPQLQQLQQYIQAQRQLQHQPPTESTASSSSTSLPYGAGGYPSGLPPPLPTLPATTTTTTSSLPSFTSTFAAAYGLPLPPSTLSSAPPPSVPSSFPPPQHYAPPLPPSQHLRPPPALPQAPPESAGGATPPKLVHILPSPAPVGALAALYTPRTAPTSYAPSSVPVPAPSTFPVSS